MVTSRKSGWTSPLVEKGLNIWSLYICVITEVSFHKICLLKIMDVHCCCYFFCIYGTCTHHIWIHHESYFTAEMWNSLSAIRVATVREKYLEMKFFPGQGKVREFCGWSGKFRKDLGSQGKVREIENKWLWQGDFRKFIYFVQEGKRCTFSWDSLSSSLSSLGATLKGKNLALLN